MTHSVLTHTDAPSHQAQEFLHIICKTGHNSSVWSGRGGGCLANRTTQPVATLRFLFKVTDAIISVTNTDTVIGLFSFKMTWAIYTETLGYSSIMVKSNNGSTTKKKKRKFNHPACYGLCSSSVDRRETGICHNGCNPVPLISRTSSCPQAERFLTHLCSSAFGTLFTFPVVLQRMCLKCNHQIFCMHNEIQMYSQMRIKQETNSF